MHVSVFRWANEKLKPDPMKFLWIFHAWLVYSPMLPNLRLSIWYHLTLTTSKNRRCFSPIVHKFTTFSFTFRAIHGHDVSYGFLFVFGFASSRWYVVYVQYFSIWILNFIYRSLSHSSFPFSFYRQQTKRKFVRNDCCVCLAIAIRIRVVNCKLYWNKAVDSTQQAAERSDDSLNACNTFTKTYGYNPIWIKHTQQNRINVAKWKKVRAINEKLENATG